LRASEQAREKDSLLVHLWPHGEISLPIGCFAVLIRTGQPRPVNMISLNSLHRFVLIASLASSAIYAEEPQSLVQTLKPYLEEFGLPALAAAVFKDGVTIATGAVGTRRAGFDLPVMIEDPFHLGSDTKAFTSLLAGMFVEEGKLRWDSTLVEIFPELEDNMNPDFAKITLEELLSHSSGLADGQPFIDLLARSYLREGNLDEVRSWLVKEIAPMPLDHARGSKFAYSNLGYTIAGAILERMGEKTWEELMEDRIIGPLNLRSAGFGPQSSLGKVDAPLGHLLQDGKAKAMLAGPNGDNPLILGPAGTLHMSVLDFAKWVAWNAGEGKHPPALVSPETLKRVHTSVIETGVREDAPPGTPKTGKYALGWGQVTEDWSPTPMLVHTGSNGMNLAVAMFSPESDFGFVMMTNIGGKGADEATRKLAASLYETFSRKSSVQSRDQ
jgi:CubicO group peptidase (beta-lactamase class C family)